MTDSFSGSFTMTRATIAAELSGFGVVVPADHPKLTDTVCQVYVQRYVTMAMGYVDVGEDVDYEKLQELALDILREHLDIDPNLED